MIRVLNLYAGIGGNRKLWKDVEVIALENDCNTAKVYKDFFPQDKVIIGDAHKYLLKYFKNFDFIWSSPPCPTHSRLENIHWGRDYKVRYPDMNLYQEIILLKHRFKGKYCVENVIPYYKYLIKPTCILHRHSLWSNFYISERVYPKMQTCTMANERKFLQKKLGFNLDKYNFKDKRLLLRNCVLPEMGLHILNQLKIKCSGLAYFFKEK